jgi:hypothetical protein
MKKVLRKMVIRSETLRLLRALDEKELARPVGGNVTSPGAADNTESRKPICPPLSAATG